MLMMIVQNQNSLSVLKSDVVASYISTIGNGLLIEECYGFSDNEQSCSDINNLYECFALGCNWVSGNMPGAGYCEEFNSDDEENDNQDEEDGPPNVY